MKITTIAFFFCVLCDLLVQGQSQNYPPNYANSSRSLGIKDVVNFSGFPIVWTNKKCSMTYINMRHDDEEFTDATQNLLFVNVFRWVMSSDKRGNLFKSKQ